MKPTRIESNTQLIVEGKDQQNFFEAFIDYLSLEDIQIQNFGGVNDLPSFLKQFVKAPGFNTVTSIGIIRDAENKMADKARQSILSALRKPDPPIDNDLVKIFVLPDDQNRGMLETILCKTFIDTGENSCIDSFFECIGKLPENFVNRRPDKARAHAFLATRKEPHVSVGVAAKKGYWSFDHDAFANIRLFLEGLQE